MQTDLYALGIVFFEMWRDLTHTGTERLMEVRALRENQSLSSDFERQVQTDAKSAAQTLTNVDALAAAGAASAAAPGGAASSSATQSAKLDLPTTKDLENARAIIEWCLRLDPSERPSARELIKSSLVPKRVESEDIDQALDAALEPTSGYFRSVVGKLMERRGSDYDDMVYSFVKPTRKRQSDFAVRIVLCGHLRLFYCNASAMPSRYGSSISI